MADPTTMTSTSQRDEVLEASAAFAAAIDERDWASLRSLVVPEVQAYGARGADDVLARMQHHLGGVGQTQHLMGNHRVTLGMESADVLSYGRVLHLGTGPMEGTSYECLGEYTDTWVRTAEGWLLSKRWFEITIEIGDRGVLRPAD
ncbi:MAG: nuclear transport factor 2 family protein [Nocardioides sp.]|uniref:nuclear transport factor 2 family protein n=1 Tax=Nocardioides sp. TaxID=35761 RepID=UPI003F111BBE